MTDKFKISGHGSSEATVMLIADGGTDSDISSGYALTGDAERKLRNIIQSAGLQMGDFWRTCLVKDRINLKSPESNIPLITDDYKESLIDEIKTVKPFILVPLSELSFRFLSGLSGIRKFRGSVLQSQIEFNIPNLRLIPSLGPNPYLYEDPKLEFITRIDFTKIRRNMSILDKPIEPQGTVWACETGIQFRNFLERHYQKCLDNGGFVTLDIETFANLPTCISFCFDGEESCCVPIIDSKISLSELSYMFSLVLKVLASPIPKVNQNIKFDWKKLERLNCHVNNIVGDTMLATSCLYPEFPKGLGFLTSIYTDMPYFKDEGKEFNPEKYDRSKLYIYNAKDALATHRIYTAQLEELAEMGTKKVYSSLIEILPIYRQMEENGILVDDSTRQKLLSKYETLYEIQCSILNKLVGNPINPLSSKQVQNLIYEQLKWKIVNGVKHSKKSGLPSADEESLEILLWSSECNHYLGPAILRAIIDCRKLHKCIEFLVLPTYPDSRHRCEFNLAGAKTGRTTAAETTDHYLYFDKGKIKMGDMGHSFQTIGKHGFTVDGVEYGKDLRAIFVPSPGYSFVECDLSQAEARVDAVLADDIEILSVFDSPVGIHRLTGSWIYGCDPMDIVKNKITLNESGVGEDRYHISKTVRHAGERNMTPKRLMMMVAKPIGECAKILKTFHSKQPNIREVFHRDIRNQIQRERNLVAPNGRRRDFFGRIDEDTINEGISQLPQSIVTDYTKNGIRKTIPITKDFVRPLSEAHDGFLVEVLKGREMEYAELYKNNIEEPIDFRTCSLSRNVNLTIPCESEWSDTNWMEMRPLK